VIKVSVKKSSKHSTHNPQSTNVAIKCPECNEFKWSYFFKRHWKEHHKRSKGPMPGNLEKSIAISELEHGYFKRGQKKLPQKRPPKKQGNGDGSGKKKKKKKATQKETNSAGGGGGGGGEG